MKRLKSLITLPRALKAHDRFYQDRLKSQFNHNHNFLWLIPLQRARPKFNFHLPRPLSLLAHSNPAINTMHLDQ